MKTTKEMMQFLADNGKGVENLSKASDFVFADIVKELDGDAIMKIDDFLSTSGISIYQAQGAMAVLIGTSIATNKNASPEMKAAYVVAVSRLISTLSKMNPEELKAMGVDV